MLVFVSVFWKQRCAGLGMAVAGLRLGMAVAGLGIAGMGLGTAVAGLGTAAAGLGKKNHPKTQEHAQAKTPTARKPS